MKFQVEDLSKLPDYATFFAFNYIFTPLLNYIAISLGCQQLLPTADCIFYSIFVGNPFRESERVREKEKWIANKRLLSFYYYNIFYIIRGYQKKNLSTSR